MELKRTFVQGQMNRDIDERLLPNGQYPNAENIRVSNTDGSDVGAIENVRGNRLVADLNLVNGVCIGAFSDSSNRKLYYFVTSDTRDLVMEYDDATGNAVRVLESAVPNGVLNFNRKNLITDVVKIINGESENDLLAWTDDLNPPRIINIERAKTFAVGGFIEDDISLIKRPPVEAPDIDLTFSTNVMENNLEDRFLRFAYRYRYLDGYYSAVSSFSDVAFSPENFQLDFQTLENLGMTNSFNAVNITFDVGDERVTDVELLVKESGSNTIFIIESFNKADEGWANDSEQTFLFSNNKTLVALPDDEVFRNFDNVPRRAKALELVGSRLVFGNYVEGFNLKDVIGNSINIDYTLSLVNEGLEQETLSVTRNQTTVPEDTLVVTLDPTTLTDGSVLTFNISLEETTDMGSYTDTLQFILNQTFTTVNDLVMSEEFQFFITSVMTNSFTQNYTVTPPANSTLISISDFAATASGNNIRITAPVVTYEIDNTPDDNTDDDTTTDLRRWTYTTGAQVFLSNIGIGTSLKSNRSYEVGIIYLDDYNRASTVQTSSTNTIYVEPQYSVTQNKIRVTLNNNPPADAVRYKFALKENKNPYQTIYTNIFYQDGLFRWVKIEGSSVNKVREGDTLIVKSDLDGFVDELIEVRVIELVTQEKDFLEGNVDENGQDIVEEAGLYMKIKPVGFNMDYRSNTFLNFYEYNESRSSRPTVFLGSSQGTLAGFFNTTTNMYEDYEIVGGSRVTLSFRNYESDGFDERYDRTFIVQGTYDNFQLWWEAEVVDLGDQEDAFDWNFQRNTSDNSLWLYVRGNEPGSQFERSKLACSIDLVLTGGIIIFETKPDNNVNEIFYETSKTFDITNGLHQGDIQNQTLTDPVIVELDAFNCYVQGNGAESRSFQDGCNTNALQIDNRPSSTSREEFRQIRRFADLTYSEPYSENSGFNGLNEFNLSRANFKEDIDKKYGFIQRLYLRDTDLVVFQEDKVSRVLFGKDLLLNADGTSNVSSTDIVLGQQIDFTGEYGISSQPESFTFDGHNLYFTDTKRGCVCRLSRDGITEISKYGMEQYFKELFEDNLTGTRVAAFDPYYNQYVLYINNNFVLTFDEDINGWTSFFSYSPDFMIGLNNKLFSFNQGDLYLHNDETVDRNTFYGQQSPSKISVMFNHNPSDVKLLQAAYYEGSNPWSARINAYVSDTNNPISSSLAISEFVRKEGMWYAYARRNENVNQLDSKSAYGIGRVIAIAGTSIVINGGSQLLTVGDTLLDTNLQVIATITGVFGTVLLVDSVDNISVGDFLIGRKNPRIEGGNLRGYTIRMDLEQESDNREELFAVNIEAMNSAQ
jgi:hypothetical protein